MGTVEHALLDRLAESPAADARRAKLWALAVTLATLAVVLAGGLFTWRGVAAVGRLEAQEVRAREAARAGEAERGFAVVAQEVKALAGQTAEATRRIAGRIDAVQAATRDAVGAIDEVRAAMDDLDRIRQRSWPARRRAER